MHGAEDIQHMHQYNNQFFLHCQYIFAEIFQLDFSSKGRCEK